MRYGWIMLLVLAACTSAWEGHRARLAEHEAKGEYAHAVADMQWMIENAFSEAPADERTRPAEGARNLRLAGLAARAGKPQLAIEALREALAADPHQATAVQAQLQHLPLDVGDLDRVKGEFAWNIAALAPKDDALLQGDDPHGQCWSYRVRELRVRHRRTVRAAAGMERQVTYDARPWLFDATSRQWRPDGPWIIDAGTEVELSDGPEQPRYRAVTAADHQFYADERVPGCHRDGWQGPYDTNGTVFVASQLPGAPAAIAP